MQGCTVLFLLKKLCYGFNHGVSNSQPQILTVMPILPHPVTQA